MDELGEVLELADLVSDDLGVVVGEDCHQEGQHDVVNDEDHRQQHREVPWVELHILVEQIDHVLVGEDGESRKNRGVEVPEVQSRVEQVRVLLRSVEEDHVEEHGQEDQEEDEQVEDHADAVQEDGHGQADQSGVLPVQHQEYQSGEEINLGLVWVDRKRVP